MSILSNLFRKQINRHIEGVIKADDIGTEHLRNEVEEYVLTRSLEDKLNKFLEAYFAKNHDENGYWISGFFGSGKSHLLKMLSVLLENRMLGDYSVIDAFVDKVPPENAELRSNIKTLRNIPSKSILFDISKNADIQTKDDVILRTFINVFNKAVGYDDTSLNVALFEWDLDEDGKLEAFKQEFERISQESWEYGRSRQRYYPQIDEAYSNIYHNPYTDVIKNYQNKIVSVQTFAKKVKSYLDRQVPQFRLNFFVDEVGQFVHENNEYVLQLQAIAESLGAECRGRASIIITSQAKLNNLLETLAQRLSADQFSKIQDRFATKLHLDSQDVEEVIQRRLLDKNDNAKIQLGTLYRQEHNNFKTLFDFTAGQTFKNFKDEDHFVECYPFIPYQFPLFQNAIEQLSAHGAFTGAYTSVGARSILSVFQHAAEMITSESGQIGDIATFDLLYEGIRNSLASIQSSIGQAEKNLNNPLAIKILKALFLVKYVKGFVATKQNIAILVRNRFDADQTQYMKDIEDALTLLEKQVYIQRSNDVYSYLTDAQKLIQQDIINTEITLTEINENLQSLIYDQVHPQLKVRYKGMDFPFNRKLDNTAYSPQKYELSVNIITPSQEDITTRNITITSMGTDCELFILLSDTDKQFIRDLGIYLKTKKYINQNMTTATANTKTILIEKSTENEKLRNNLMSRARELITHAHFYHKGNELANLGTEPTGCFVKAFQIMVDKVYSHLGILKDHIYTTDEMNTLIYNHDIFTDNMDEAAQEVYSYMGNNNTYARMTVANVCERFSQKPYGWPMLATLCQIAKLYARSSIIIQENSNILDDAAVARTLNNTAKQNNLLLQVCQSYSQAQIRGLKDFYQDFCQTPITSSDARVVADQVKASLEQRQHEVEALLNQKDYYPFLSALAPVAQRLARSINTNYNWYYEQFSAESDALLAENAGLTVPMRSFMNGPQRTYYDEIRRFINENGENLGFISADVEALKQALADQTCYKGPALQELKEKIEAYRGQIHTLLGQERSKAVSVVENARAEAHSLAQWQALSEADRQSFDAEYNNAAQNCQNKTIISSLRYAIDDFENHIQVDILNRIVAKATPKPQADPATPTQPQTPTHQQIIRLSDVNVRHNKAFLETAADIEEYLSNLRQAVEKELADGKKIKL